MELKEAAALLNGGEYRRDEFKREITNQLKEAGIVAVTGESDDIVSLYGAIRDECGFEVMFFDGELLQNACDDDRCPYFEKLTKKAKIIKASFDEGENDDPTWQFTVPVDHETFDLMEDGKVFSRGAVFYLKDM
ncbi:hypothetical protein [Sulfitobacter sp. R18_1]|uniref:hypothetical protein n=1 Tax=Sulfitobacter sp. R18_1 TaxID=2821104 RepID=UPI001ADBC94A|nr:hypothetical protein [Sulfitobacter sp. R18_1]MBO9428699.1 hypothetical protein [Sulfitobacter sp. R18_1]